MGKIGCPHIVLIILNSIILLLGLVLLILGIVQYVGVDKFGADGDRFSNILPSGEIVKVAGLISLVAGIFFILMAILGILGAAFSNTCLLVFFVILCVIFGVAIFIPIIILLVATDIADSAVKLLLIDAQAAHDGGNFTSSSSSSFAGVQASQARSNKDNILYYLMSPKEQGMECCGVNGCVPTKSDNAGTLSGISSLTTGQHQAFSPSAFTWVTMNCNNEFCDVGCHEKSWGFVTANGYVIVAIGLILFFFIFIAEILACIICCRCCGQGGDNKVM